MTLENITREQFQAFYQIEKEISYLKRELGIYSALASVSAVTGIIGTAFGLCLGVLNDGWTAASIADNSSQLNSLVDYLINASYGVAVLSALCSWTLYWI